MSQEDIDFLINKDEAIISCKKRAKQLHRLAQTNKEKSSLMQCQNKAASEMGFKDWFELHHSIKQKIMMDIALTDVNINKSVADVFQDIIDTALKEHATNIHICAKEGYSHIQMRIHGEIMEYQKNFEYEEINSLCSFIFNVLALNTIEKSIVFNPTEYQSAGFNYFNKNNDLFILLQTIPIYPNGYEMVLNLKISQGQKIPELHQLGYEQSHLKEILNITNHQTGSLFFSGTTGSGKTNSIYSLLNYLNAESEYRKTIVTVEDPPESQLSRIHQIPVIHNNITDYSKVSIMATAVKLAQNYYPEIMMISDMRSSMDALVLYKASFTSYIISNIHASSAIGVIERLTDFGLEYKQLISNNFLKGTVHQRLIPVVCPHCSINFSHLVHSDIATHKDIELGERILKLQSNYTSNNFFSNIKTRNKLGCKHCNHKGIISLTLCAEVLTIDDTIKSLIGESNIKEIKQYWTNLSDKNIYSDNMQGKTVKEHALLKMFKGLIDPYDIESCFSQI